MTGQVEATPTAGVLELEPTLAGSVHVSDDQPRTTMRSTQPCQISFRFTVA